MKRMLFLAVFVASSAVAGSTVTRALANAGTRTGQQTVPSQRFNSSITAIGIRGCRPASSGAVLADGDPPPPWPKQTSTLLADGDPPPPWPKQTSTLLADGDPPPPWPKQNAATVGVLA
jgi:hypothetical protein